uniref:Alternative protein EREG n=1 Tax=Homo sapiens TaxID=9606 RepID=L8E9W3_HUMAN|nr:alternative protein EREG [Homo sapiens]
MEIQLFHLLFKEVLTLIQLSKWLLLECKVMYLKLYLDTGNGKKLKN